MATTLTALTATQTIIPYVGGANIDFQLTGIPRAEMIFSLSDAVITIAGSGEDQAVVITCTLPTQFAYVFAECSVLNFQIEDATDIADWDDICVCRIRNQGKNAWKYSFDMFSRGVYQTSTVNFDRSYHLANNHPLQKVIVPGTSCNLTLQFFNPVIDGKAGIIQGFFCRFWVFDVNQAQQWPVNTPVPVR